MQAGPRPHQPSPPLKHRPFQSIYRPEFEVVGQQLGNQRLYPHTDQLPLLWRALNLEFYGALPGHIARTDKRADGRLCRVDHLLHEGQRGVS